MVFTRLEIIFTKTRASFLLEDNFLNPCGTSELMKNYQKFFKMLLSRVKK